MCHTSLKQDRYTSVVMLLGSLACQTVRHGVRGLVSFSVWGMLRLANMIVADVAAREVKLVLDVINTVTASCAPTLFCMLRTPDASGQPCSAPTP